MTMSIGGVSASGLQLQAATPAAGTPLVNGTPVLLSWTPPNDGKLHRVIFFGELNVTTLEVGGQIVGAVVTPSENADAKSMFAAGQGVGVYTPFAASFPQIRNVAPGQLVQVYQNSPLTSGAASFWGEIWGL